MSAAESKGENGSGLVLFSHGKDSSPKATKITALRPIAEAHGWTTRAIDYGDVNDAQQRLKMLLADAGSYTGKLILVGSSLGGLVSVIASQQLQLEALFLLAPAVYWPGFEQLDYSCKAGLVEIVHGWHDDVVPVDVSIRLAREHSATLHVINDDHRLIGRLGEVKAIFNQFLNKVDAKA